MTKTQDKLDIKAQEAHIFLKDTLELFNDRRGDVSQVIVIIMADLIRAMIMDLSKLVENEPGEIRGESVLNIIIEALSDYLNYLNNQLILDKARAKH